MIKYIVLFLLPVLAFTQELVNVTKTDLNIAIGIDQTLRLKYKFNKKGVFIGKEDILGGSIVTSRQELTLKGFKPGKTSVTVRDLTGEIREQFIVTVTSDGNSNIVRELRELIGDIEGIEIGIKGGKVIIDGKIIVPDDFGRVAAITGLYPDVLLLVEYSKQTQLIVAREMQDAINRNGMKDVSVSFVNGDYWLEGVVNQAGKKQFAQDIATAYIPNKITSLGNAAGGNRFQENQNKGGIVNFINVNEKKDPPPPPKLVKVSAQFVELSKDYNKIFAFKWAPFMANESSITFGRDEVDGEETGGISTSQNGTLSGTISRLFPKLQSAKNAGYARVIQSGMAVSNNEQRIKISKSSEINFAVGTGEGQEPRTATVSFDLATVPAIQTQENIELRQLAVTVALPTVTAAGGAPRVTRNEVQTQVTVKSKESAVIGGIVQSNSSTNYDKDDPDPVGATGGDGDSSNQSSQLFNLLRSKSYTTQKSQFVVFVTPEILESASKGTEEIRRKFKKRQR